MNVTKSSPTPNRKKELSKSEPSLVKFKEKDNKRQKKKVIVLYNSTMDGSLSDSN